ncbi:DUF4395 domain-containing protein [Nocardioides marmoribigeumensis]|uniref:DUF4395 domain-containing protein n=1 Tax=Nocardioides marmoribigeumensis TaxID=433649 RepID=A0ABU2BUV0_9ACTN|nr:DUF4395 domain-containing protein [Nocardioides marmoribigeumensis]MDR7362031.1 hypothetical protein [Nocardioides marmoribigeumensis]
MSSTRTVDPVATTPQIDPRGQRFAAWLTTAVLVAVLVSAPSPLTTALLVAQGLVFLSGVALGPARTPYSWLFRTFVRPRLGAPAETESALPPRFAQGVGLVFAAVALLGALAGSTLVVLVAAGMALAAAFLNAAFGFCLGCEMYLLGLRLVPRDRLSHAATLLRDSAVH